MQQKYCLVSDCLLLLLLLFFCCFFIFQLSFLKLKEMSLHPSFRNIRLKVFGHQQKYRLVSDCLLLLLLLLLFFFWMQTVSLKSKRDMTSSKFQFQKRQWKNIPPFLSLKLTGKKSYHRNLRFQMNAFILILCDFSFFREEL